jgi:hypothetical protein
MRPIRLRGCLHVDVHALGSACTDAPRCRPAALLSPAFLLRGPVSLLRLMAETYATTLEVIGAFKLGWLLFWVIVQRW